MLTYWKNLYEFLRNRNITEENKSLGINFPFNTWISLNTSNCSLSYKDYPKLFTLKLPILSIDDPIGYKCLRADLAHTYFPGVKIFGIGNYYEMKLNKCDIDNMSFLKFKKFCFKSLEYNLRNELTNKFFIKTRRSNSYINHWGLVSVNVNYCTPQDNLNVYFTPYSLEYRFKIFPWNVFFLIYSENTDIWTYIQTINKTYTEEAIYRLARCC